MAMRRHVLAVLTGTLMVVALVAPGSAASAATSRHAAARLGAAAAPVLTVTPTSDLVDQQTVDVSGSGFTPQARGAVTQCVVGGSCDAHFLGNVLAGADGTFHSSLDLHVRTEPSGLPGGNCISTACEVRVILADGTVADRVPLTFRAGQTLPPYLTVTPAQNLRHDQTVLVTGRAFPSGAHVFVTECHGGLGICGETLQGADVVVAADGSFARSVKVSRILDVGSPGFPRYEDCAREDQPCRISAVYESGLGGVYTFGSGPLGFDATSAVPGTPPTVIVTPSGALPAAATVTVDLTNFTPGEAVRTQFCASRGLQSICTAAATGVPDASNAARVSVEVRRLSVGPDGRDFDCFENATCIISADGLFAHERVRKPVYFDPDSPIPDRPALSLHDLTVTEGSDGGQTPARMRITLSEPAPRRLAVGWRIDVASPSQYNPSEGMLPIPAGATEVTIPLRVVADGTDEPDLEVPVQIFVGTGYTVERARATLRILDDDAPSADPPAVALIAKAEADEFTPTIRVAVGLATPVQHTVTVHFRTVDVTAVAGTDYVAKRSSVTFQPGEVLQYAHFQILDDHVREGHEHFHVVITRVDGGIRARGNNVDILDND
jgi:hypothetical protein